MFDLHQCYEEMQKQAAQACAAVAAQTAAVRGSGILGQTAAYSTVFQSVDIYSWSSSYPDL